MIAELGRVGMEFVKVRGDFNKAISDSRRIGGGDTLPREKIGVGKAKDREFQVGITGGAKDFVRRIDHEFIGFTLAFFRSPRWMAGDASNAVERVVIGPLPV